ncbi:TetR/AcrR family transcriptional regulator [Sulfuriflexus mobilis]|uniref:TetR/AcrR family transcriptional regulator n=1 Tax=Sulfuriflexus mobilis TaxID=1811807 RepID=UPI001558D275|nr:TetR/AcrR family transcriptional regulator [Sulfuriflexus mobilis]
MPRSVAHKQRSRQKILESAVKLFTHQGFDNTSIDQVMNEAEMTRGAFYAHFSSKSELYQVAILSAALNTRLIQQKPDDMDEQSWLTSLLNGYLSTAHLDFDIAPCPLAFLTTDVAVREPAVRTTYTKVFKGMNKRILNYVKSYSACDENRMLAITAMMIGGVAVARALNDKAMTEQLLESCKVVAQGLLDKD